MAKVPSINGIEDFYSYYFADTICGLIDYLDNHDIGPEGVALYGLYLKKEVQIEKELCLDTHQKWLGRPKICRSLEAKFKKTLKERYKGHIENDPCSIDDRERKGRGIGVS